MRPLGLSFIFLFFLARFVSATDFFVDKNSIGGSCNDNNTGTTIESPWCTIHKANHFLMPGDTVNIRAGIYDEIIEPKHSGQSQKPIIYTKFKDEKVIVRGRPGKYRIVNIGGFETDWKAKSYIIIDGLWIERGYPEKLNNRRHSLIAIYGPKSTHNIIRNCILTGTDKPLLEAWDSAWGLRAAGIAINKSSHNLIENNTIKDMTFMGILIGGVPRPRFNIIRNNHIYNFIQDGIHSGTAKRDDTLLGLLIEGNKIHGSHISDGIEADGCYSEVDSSECTGVAGVIVRNNHIYNNAENNIDLKGTRYWVIENNILFGAAGNNDGGYKAGPQYKCNTPPCNNTQGGTNITKGGNRYSSDIIIRNNIIYDGHGGVVIWDNYIIYNNTILNNRRTYAGPNQSVCITDGCSRKPGFPGIYGPGKNAVIINNILGDNGLAVSRCLNPKWHIDHNCYYWSIPKAFKGLAHYLGKRNWHAYTLEGWQQHLKQSNKVTGKDEHSIIGTNPNAIFKRVGSAPYGNHKQFDFDLAPQSPAINAGCPLTHAVQNGSGSTLIVKDARFFFDGYGVTKGDFIAVGTNRPVRIKQVNYITNELRLAKPISWEIGDHVSKPFAGTAPDIGARESHLIKFPINLKIESRKNSHKQRKQIYP